MRNAFFLCVLGFVLPIAGRASDLNFEMVNETPRSFEAVYVSSANDGDWDGNLLREQMVLVPEETIKFAFAGTDKDPYWDIKVVDSEGVAYRFDRVNLIDVETATLKVVDGKYTIELE